MTQTATFAGDSQRIQFFSLFVGSQKSDNGHDDFDLLPSAKTKKESPLLQWFKESEVITPVEFNTIPAGNVLQTELLLVKFELSDRYRDQFVLLRGLLEFSRPVTMSISSNAADKTFLLYASIGTAESIIAYLTTIQGLFINEIKFKKSLNKVLHFERAVKQEQVQLYAELRASIR